MEHLLELVKTASERRHPSVSLLWRVEMITIDLPPERIKSEPEGRKKKNPHYYRTRITADSVIFITNP